ncbi:WD40 repeat domain-containing protein [Leptolyngbya sp. AN03gr2]
MRSLLELRWQSVLSDYVTAIAWSPDGKMLAVCSAAGEVVLYATRTFDSIVLQTATGSSIDCLAFSHDGQFLAASGQAGTVQIWQLTRTGFELIKTLTNASAWIDQLQWSPIKNQIAFSLGKTVQIWDAETQQSVTTLDFNESSIGDIAWHPSGESISLGGYQGIKIWMTAKWEEDPYQFIIPSASTTIAWSASGRYLASGNLDRTLSVLEWGNPAPWMMSGFPGKVRQIAWSDRPVRNDAPLLASASAEGIVVWEKHEDEQFGWESRVLGQHDGYVQAVRFQPNTTLLASASEDGSIVLWWQAASMTQILEGAPDGFSYLAWHPQGSHLAAGGQQGELLVWSQPSRGQGFKRR